MATDFKISTNGPNVVRISIGNKACLLQNETISKLKQASSEIEFSRLLLKEIETSYSILAEEFKVAFKANTAEMMKQVQAFDWTDSGERFNEPPSIFLR